MRYALLFTFLFCSFSLNAELCSNDVANLKKLEKQFKNQENKVQNGIDDQFSSNMINSSRLAFWGGIAVAVFGSAENNKKHIAAGLLSAFISYLPYYLYENEALCQWKHRHPRKFDRVVSKINEIEESIIKKKLQDSKRGKKLVNDVRAFQERLENLCKQCKKS